MYKAITEIGGYKPGEVVPDKDALIWKDMYLVSPVEEVSDSEPMTDKEVEEAKKNEEAAKDHESEKPKEESKEDPSDNMLDDYLGRNQKVVTKNVREDNLSKDQLEKLLKIERSDKARPKVISAINKKLGEMN